MRPQRSYIPILAAVMLSSTSVTAQFGPQQQFFCQGPRSVDVVDVDGDGSLDLVIAARQGIGLYINTGSGQFSEPIFLGTEETIATTADVNGDGHPDVIGGRENNGGIDLFMNSGQGVFEPAMPIIADAVVNEMECADLDGDGDEDLFFVTAGGQLLCSMNTDGQGLFGAPIDVASLTQLAFAQAVDIDADGDLDLLFSSKVMNEVDVCTNINGVFNNQEQLSVAGHGTVRDIDNDGRPDAIIANTASGMVSWQRNGVDQQAFGLPEVIDPSFNSPEYLATSDLDGDGDQDAIITSSVLQEVAWFENTDGMGAFGPHQTVTFGVPVSSIATGDVDNDGDADMFVASNDLNKVIWYTNMTNATGKIMGRVFNDLNGDGVFNGNDHGLLNMRVEASDLGATYTNASGMYWFNAVPTEYIVSKPAENNWSFTTPTSYDVVVPVQGASQHNDFGLQADGTFSELTPDLGSAPIRCGNDISYWATVANTGNQVSDVEMTLDLDDLSTFVTSDPQPTSTANGVATWIFPLLQPTHQRQVHIIVHMPGSEHTGETLHDIMHATALVDGSPLSVDNFEYMPIVMCAVDPNDKQVTPVGQGLEHLTAMGSELTYRIRFQNTGNAPAQTVTLVDTLDASLDASTIRVLGSSHACHTVMGTDGVLRFTFENIDLPDSASAPVESQGYVRFAVHHHSGLAEGTAIRNKAAIYFDNNDPVITGRTLNTMTFGELTGITEEMTGPSAGITVYPNPAQNTATVRMSDDLEGRIELNMYSALGSLVKQYTRRANTVLIDRGELPDGVYLLRAKDERGVERTTRVEFAR